MLHKNDPNWLKKGLKLVIINIVLDSLNIDF